eukprot:comp18025_c0_seq1/m.18533 comp18025_c0_seq1/g.18533  ORF comp18025_c0_seq1/g.18533 comp18025_c0_seq1/m.18533 type:complete len:106 (-) comp18025_c0_seq1:367-684(-)
MVHVLVVHLQVKQGAGSEVLARFKVLADHVQAHEPECLTYVASVGETDPDTIVIYERYTTKEALTGPHNSSKPFQEFSTWLFGSGVVVESKVLRCTETDHGFASR